MHNEENWEKIYLLGMYMYTELNTTGTVITCTESILLPKLLFAT